MPDGTGGAEVARAGCVRTHAKRHPCEGARTPHAMAGWRRGGWAHPQDSHARPIGQLAVRDAAEAGEELELEEEPLRVERLDEEVVGACLECGDLVADGVARGDDHDEHTACGRIA